MSDFKVTGLFAFPILIFLIVVGCEQTPESRLPPDEILVELIYDLHIAEATMNRINYERQDSVSLLIREKIAGSYGITPAQMDAWLEELQKSPEHMIAVYDSVIAKYERSLRE